MYLNKIFIFFLIVCLQTKAQNYIIYDTKKTDTPKSIAQDFNISLDLLYKFNPDLHSSNTIGKRSIVIPKKANNDFSIFTYRVKNKQTLYSISRTFNVSIKDIKAFNSQLYDKKLQAGQKLRLPAYKLPEEYQNFDFNQSIKNSSFKAFKHIVLPNENKSIISKKYGLTIQEFDSLNPNLYEVQTGQLVKIIPKQTDDDNLDIQEINMELLFYEVPPKKTIYSLTKEFRINEEIIYKLNPILRREGLKEGTIIKLPRQIEKLEETKFVNLENYIQNLNEKKIALLLPFNLDYLQSLSNQNDRLKKQILQDELLQISLDIYVGVQWAVEHAKSKKIYTELEVFDTKRKTSTVSAIVTENNLSKKDAIIGPILEPNITTIAKSMSTEDVPIFIPITKSEVKNPMVIHTLPDQNIKTEALITYLYNIKRKKDVNLIFITDKTSKDFYSKYKYTFPKATFFKVGKTYVETKELQPYIKAGVENYIVVETTQVSLSESVINNLYLLQKSMFMDKSNTQGITLFTSNRNKAFGEVISNEALCQLGFTYISASKYDIQESNPLINEFVIKNGYLPNRFVLRAFDITYDIILRLAYDGRVNNAISLSPITEYNENRFAYHKSFMSNIYTNKGIYFIKYLPNYQYEVLDVQLP